MTDLQVFTDPANDPDNGSTNPHSQNTSTGPRSGPATNPPTPHSPHVSSDSHGQSGQSGQPDQPIPTSLPMPQLRPMAERDTDPGWRWAEFAAAEPGLAAQVRARFALARHHVLATLTIADAPRVSGTEVVWDTVETNRGPDLTTPDPVAQGIDTLGSDPHDGDLDLADMWLAMMPGSRKGEDLRRDWRFAIHVNPGDQTMTHPDVKLSGTAQEIPDGPTRRAFAARNAPDQQFDLFRLSLRSVVRTAVIGDLLGVTTWRPGLPLDVRTRA